MNLGKVSQQNNVAPEKQQPVQSGTLQKISGSVSTAYKSADVFVTNKVQKINEEGYNPFGSKSDIDENKKVNGLAEKQAIKSFNKLDINNDGFLTRRELIDSSNSKNIDIKDASVIGSLLESQNKIQNLSNDERGPELKGITKKDIVAIDNLVSSDLKVQVEGNYYLGLDKIGEVEKTIKDKNGDFILPKNASDVNFKDITQGSLGDCYFLATLTAYAQKNPQKIVDMIHDNKNGTYTVDFKGKSVTITAPNKTELGLYSSEGKGAWVPIIEKAYAQYREDNSILKKENNYDVIGKGSIIIGRGMYELSGSTFDTDILKAHSQDTLRKKLSSAQDKNKMMVAAINKGILGKNKLDLPDGHVYTVLGYDEKTDKVKIRNPWGNDTGNVKGGKEGIFELSVADFQKTFSQVAFEK